MPRTMLKFEEMRAATEAEISRRACDYDGDDVEALVNEFDEKTDVAISTDLPPRADETQETACPFENTGRVCKITRELDAPPPAGTPSIPVDFRALAELGIGSVVRVLEWDPEEGRYTGRAVEATVTSVEGLK